MKHRALAVFGLVAGSAAPWGAVLAEYGLNLPRGVTPVSERAYDLHMLIFAICCVIAAVVFGVMFYSIVKHRKSQGVEAAQFHENTRVEVIWTLVPVLILVGMAIPATKALVAMEDTSNSDLTIQVTGYQWKWKYDYLDEEISFFSNMSTTPEEIAGEVPMSKHYLLDVDEPLVVPINKKIRILTTAADVIHAWWVPELGFKRDAIPGFINESWALIKEPGVYRGQCAELCGKDHGFMPIVVVAKTEDEYRQWVSDVKAEMEQAAAAAERTWAMDELMAKGEEVYNTNCAACHQPNGQGMGEMFPALAGNPVLTGDDPEEHIEAVLAGRPGTPMAAFGPQLDDGQLAAVITYTRNAWGNDTGQAIQPDQIKAMR